MRTESFMRAVTANIGLKIVSILFAVFLWFYVTAQIERTETIEVPLEIVNMPESLVVVNDVPRTVEVTMRGARSDLLKARLFGKTRLTVDLAGAQGRRLSVPLSKGMITLPEGVRQEDVSIRSPRSLSIELETHVSRSIPVEIAFRGTLPAGMMLVGKPAVAPDRVIARGPAGAMSALAAARTEPIDLNGRRGRFSAETALSAVAGVAFEPPTVIVEIAVSRRGERTFEGLAPTFLQLEEGLAAACEPPTATLTVQGPDEFVRSLSPDEVSIVLSLEPGATGTFTIEPEVIVPALVDTFRLSVSAFEVTVAPKR